MRGGSCMGRSGWGVCEEAGGGWGEMGVGWRGDRGRCRMVRCDCGGVTGG